MPWQTFEDVTTPQQHEFVPSDTEPFFYFLIGQFMAHITEDYKSVQQLCDDQTADPPGTYNYGGATAMSVMPSMANMQNGNTFLNYQYTPLNGAPFGGAGFWYGWGPLTDQPTFNIQPFMIATNRSQLDAISLSNAGLSNRITGLNVQFWRVNR